MRRRARALVAAGALVCITTRAAADPAPSGFLHMRSPSHVETQGGSKLDLPPGYFMDEPTYDRVDGEVRRLQDVEHRLTAERDSLRKSVDSFKPGWLAVIGVLVVGVAGGIYVGTKL